MATLNVWLPDKMKQWVDKQVRTGRYGTASDYVCDLVRRDQERADMRACSRCLGRFRITPRLVGRMPLQALSCGGSLWVSRHSLSGDDGGVVIFRVLHGLQDWFELLQRTLCTASQSAYIYTRCPAREDTNIPGALIDLEGAVPDRTRGFGHTAPTYVSRFPGSLIPRPGWPLF